MPLFLKFVFLSFCSGCLWFLDDGDNGSWVMVTMIMKMIYLVHIIVNISPMVAFFQQTLPQLLRRNSFEERWTLVKILDRVWLCDDHEVEDEDDKYLHERSITMFKETKLHLNCFLGHRLLEQVWDWVLSPPTPGKHDDFVAIIIFVDPDDDLLNTINMAIITNHKSNQWYRQ